MPITRRNAKRRNEGPVSGSDWIQGSQEPFLKKHKTDQGDTHHRDISGQQLPSMPKPLKYKRLLPQIVDDLAKTDPRGVWLSIPTKPDSAEFFYDITYTQLANAVNRAAWWINDKIKSTEHGPHTLAYLGPADSRYFILVIAAVKAGHRLLLPSSRNAGDAQCKLLKDTKCDVLLCAKEEVQMMEDVLTANGPVASTCVIHTVPEQHELLNQKPARRFTYSKTYEQEQRQAFVILHTSGTSNEVVPIELPHSYYAYEDVSRNGFIKDGVITFAPLKPGVRCLYTGPLYHAGAILFTLMKGLLLKATMLLPPARAPVTADVIESCLVNGRASMLGTAPSVLEDLCSSVARRKCLEALKCIFCGSGPMPKSVGDTLRSIDVKLLHIYGSTETALLPQLPLEDPVNDWQYFKFHPASGATFVSLGKGELHELVIKRLDGDTPQPCFEVLPTAWEYHTKDTFSAHDSKPGLWRFRGRVDDIITLTNGEKFCPSAAEELITSHTKVAAALIVGQGRFQPVLVLSLHAPLKPVKQMIDDLWPLIEEANTHMPGYAQIVRHFVLMSDKPFLRTPKGTIRRHRTEQSLHSEITAVYEHRNHSLVDSCLMPDLRCQSSLQDFLHRVVLDHILVGRQFSMESDLFALGLDSMKVAALVSMINASLRQSSKITDSSAKKVRPQFVYENPSIARLAAALHSLIDTPDILTKDQEAWEEDHKALLDRHIANVPRAIRAGASASEITNDPSLGVVVLTGSTGSLGRHLLHALLCSPRTSHVYCIDRSPNAKGRYLATFSAHVREMNRVTFLHVPCLDEKNLGVRDRLTYMHMTEHVSTIIHSAWPVNFNLPLRSPPGHEGDSASFESHIAGVRRLIEFAATAPRKPQLVFISSLSSVLRYKGPASRCIPEAIIEDPGAPMDGGYGRSKWLAERMIDMAAKGNGAMVRPKVIRVGQIAGPSPRLASKHGKGSNMWPANEMIPSMIRSSATIKALPESLQAMEKLRWTNVDDAAQIILEIAADRGESDQVAAPGVRVYNVTNIQSKASEKTWKEDMLPFVKERLEKVEAHPVEVVSMQEWLDRVEAQGMSKSSSERGIRHSDNPAMRLIGFYEELVGSDVHSGLGDAIETRSTRRASQTFRRLQPILPDWMGDWMAAWGL